MIAGDEIADLADRDADLLDGRHYDEWLALLTEDFWYWIPLTQDQPGPLSGPSHVWETRDALTARILRLKDANNLPQQPPSRVSRILGRHRVVQGAEEWHGRVDLVTRLPFHLVEALPHHDAESATRIFAGTITYGLVRQAQDLRIRWRRVDLINSEKGLHGVSILL